jgi:protein-tyrosine phosphatase
MKILFVCLGNICRSPIAEGVMKSLVLQNQLHWQIESAGTESYHVGQPPHVFSQEVCLEKGIDISDQRARQFQKSDFDHFDKIYALATDVLHEITLVGKPKTNKDQLLLFLNEQYPLQQKSVKDPWYGTKEGYYPVFDEIKSCCEVILEKYRK